MSIMRVLPRVSATAGTPTPIYTGTVLAAVGFQITNGIATITCGSLPANGYNLGQEVTLWGFTTATYFNGLTVTVTANNPALFQFSFNTTHANVSYTGDAGNTAMMPMTKYMKVRLEIDQAASTYKIYVGDKSVSSTQYTACLQLSSQNWVEIDDDNIDASRIFIDTSNTGTYCQVTLLG
jgi:hypothetical protein